MEKPTEIYRFGHYVNTVPDNKDSLILGKFIKGAEAHKGMVTEEISRSGNKLAGFSKMKIARKAGAES